MFREPVQRSLCLAKGAVHGARARVGSLTKAVRARVEEPIREFIAMQERTEAMSVEREEHAVCLFGIAAGEERGSGIGEQLAEIGKRALRALGKAREKPCK